MSPRGIFLIHLALGYFSWALLIRTYVWPRLKAITEIDAQRAILTFHSFRFFGLVFLLPGFTGPALPAAFTEPAAFGDLAASILALLAIVTIRRGFVFWAFVIAFNVVGAGDLIMNVYQTIALNLARDSGQFGAAYAIPILYVPGLVITHGLSVYLMIRAVSAPKIGRAVNGQHQKKIA